MSTKTLALYGGVFVSVLITMLFVTGVFQQGIQPRVMALFASEEPPPAEEAPKKAAAGEATAKPAEPKPPEAASAAPVAPTSSTALAQVPSSPTGTMTSSGPAPATEPPKGTDADIPKRLARVYEGMRPKEAAGVLEKLERPLAAEVLGYMRERQAAKILGAMNADTAAELSRLLGQPRKEDS
jgi:hypothetical protein